MQCRARCSERSGRTGTARIRGEADLVLALKVLRRLLLLIVVIILLVMVRVRLALFAHRPVRANTAWRHFDAVGW